MFEIQHGDLTLVGSWHERVEGTRITSGTAGSFPAAASPDTMDGRLSKTLLLS